MEDLEASVVCRCCLSSPHVASVTWEAVPGRTPNFAVCTPKGGREVAARQFLGFTTTMENTTSKEQNPEKQVEGANEGEVKEQNAEEDVRLQCLRFSLTACHQLCAVVLQPAEQHRIWRRNAPFLYDVILVYTSEWPSLTVQWLPDKVCSLFLPPSSLTFHYLLSSLFAVISSSLLSDVLPHLSLCLSFFLIFFFSVSVSTSQQI